MDVLKKFIDFVRKKHLFNKNDLLLIAVSGGIDSCVLCDLCKQAGYNFKIAHCNFQLRGQESERDEAFVRSLGEKYSTEVFVKKFDTILYAAQNNMSIQVAARELRYGWFYELAENQMTGGRRQRGKDNRGQRTDDSNLTLSTVNYQQSTPHILTAHHANDNIETVLMNFFKGTGIQGLKGIDARTGPQNVLIRPLLFAKKLDIEQYAAEQQLAFVEDSSNAEEKYTRNYFRNQLIPAVQKVFPLVEDNLVDNIKRFADISLLYQESIERHKKKLLVKKNNEIHLPVLKLLQTPAVETILYEVIKVYGFSASQVNEVVKLLKSGSGKFVQSTSHKIIKNRNWIIISPIQTLLAQNIIVENEQQIIDFEQGKLKFSIIPNDLFKILSNENVAQLDASKITFPLLLRKWKTGDYFYPLGMEKKKKLSRFFIDKKLPITIKEKMWVLEMNKKIIWVIGLRIDDRFKITGDTKNILKVVLSFS